MNDILLVTGISVLVCLLSVLCMLVVRKQFGHEALARHNDVAGFIYAVIGVVYAVLLAFIVIVEWEMFRDTDDIVQEEVRYMASVFRDVRVFSDKEKAHEIQHAIDSYARTVVNEEWPLMAEGKSSSRGLDKMHDIFSLTASLHPADDYEKIWYREVIENLNDFSDARNQRVLAAEQALPPFMWFMLIFGGVVTIGFSFLFGTGNSTAHALMVISLASVITIVLMMIYTLDHPYSGIIAVTPDAFIRQIARFNLYFSGAVR